MKIKRQRRRTRNGESKEKRGKMRIGEKAGRKDRESREEEEKRAISGPKKFRTKENEKQGIEGKNKSERETGDRRLDLNRGTQRGYKNERERETGDSIEIEKHGEGTRTKESEKRSHGARRRDNAKQIEIDKERKGRARGLASASPTSDPGG